MHKLIDDLDECIVRIIRDILEKFRERKIVVNILLSLLLFQLLLLYLILTNTLQINYEQRMTCFNIVVVPQEKRKF